MSPELLDSLATLTQDSDQAAAAATPPAAPLAAFLDVPINPILFILMV